MGLSVSKIKGLDMTISDDYAVITITQGDGTQIKVSFKEFSDALTDRASEIETFIDRSYSVEQSYGNGLALIDVHPYKLAFGEDSIALVDYQIDVDLKPGQYYVLYNEVRDSDKNVSITNSQQFKDGFLLPTATELVDGDGATLMPIDIGTEAEQAVFHAWMVKVGDDPVTFKNLVTALTALASYHIVLEHYGYRDNQDEEEREVVDTRLEVAINRVERIDFTTDKVNRSTWNLWARLEPGQIAAGFEEDGNGLIGVDLANQKDKKKGIQRLVTYSINFDNLKDADISKRLEPYDERVYEALATLWRYVAAEGGQDTFSLKDIYYAMGYTTEPSEGAKKKINDSITKMAAAHIEIDNYDEAEAYNYPRFKYDASLLPMERITGYVGGQLTDGLVHLYREPPLFTFARQRGQITTGSVQLLQTPLNKTNKNIELEDYLRTQIAWMKTPKGKRDRKITFENMFKELQTTRRDDKARQKKNAVKILEHYVKCGWIKSFKQVAEGFAIYY